MNALVITLTLVNDFRDVDRHIATDTIARIISHYWWWLPIAFASCLLFLLCRAMLYSNAINIFTGKKDFKTAVSTTLTGFFYEKVTPFGAGSQAFQIHHLRDKNLPNGAEVTVPMIEYISGRMAHLILSVVAITLNAIGLFDYPVEVQIGIYVIAIIGIALNGAFPALLILTIFSRRACAKITKGVAGIASCLRLTKDRNVFYETVMNKLDANIECMKIAMENSRIWLCLMFSIMSSLFYISVGYFILKSFGFHTTHGWGWAEIVIINFLIINAVSLIPSPGGAGVADLSFYVVFSAVLFTSTGVQSGAIATLVWRGIGFYFPLLIAFIGILFISRGKRKRKRQNATLHSENLIQDEHVHNTSLDT